MSVFPILHHLGIAVPDLKRSEAFFVKYFGFKPIERFQEGTPEEFVQLNRAGMILELHSLPVNNNEVQEHSDAPYPFSKKLGLTHIGFSVVDMNPLLSLASSESW